MIIKLAKTLKIKITIPKIRPLFLVQFIKTLSKENADMLNPIIEIIDVFRVSQKKLYLSGKGSGIINAKITTVKSGTVIKNMFHMKSLVSL